MRIIAFALVVLLATFSHCGLFPSAKDDETKTALSNAEPNATQASNPGELKPSKKRILVLNLLNKSRHGGEELIAIATDKIKEQLLTSPEISLVPIQEIEGNEFFENELGEYNLPLIMQKARTYGVSGVVMGKIQDLSIKQSGDDVGLFRTKTYIVSATVKVMLYDTATEKEIFNRVATAEVSEEHTEFFKNRTTASFDPERGKIAVAKALEKVIPPLPDYAKKLAWTGRIAKIEFHRYYITAGEMSGISRGQLLKVFGEGQNVFEPDTKRLIGIAPGRFKGLLKVIDQFGEDGSVAVVHSGGGFREKDRVELFTVIQR
jgi:hypothetical protein